MNLPILIQQLYGEFSFTGLYSFEFVDKKRKTLSEIFLLTPPKSKSTSEPTRSSTVPTLGGNYTIDGGNATKNVSLTGSLYFEYIGSPDNPVARDNSGLENTLSGMEEFFKMQFMLIRYRDYTMTKNAKMTVPTTILSVSPEINRLYKNISKRVKDKTGGLYDEVKLIFHDYDMNDHYYCRVDTFSSSQSDTKYNAIDYTIELELYEPDNKQTALTTAQVKPTNNESVNAISRLFENIDYSARLAVVSSAIGYDQDLVSSLLLTETGIANIVAENEAIQSGQSVPLSNLPSITTSLKENVVESMDSILSSFLSNDQLTSYAVGDITLDDVLDPDMVSFFNSLQKVYIQNESLIGVLNSIPQLDTIRYSENADDYTLTEEQFSEDSSQVESTFNFYYYTVLEGDTSMIIALRELNDPEKFVSILQINDISENQLIDGSLIGQQIKIPLDATTLSRGDDNLVYEANVEDVNLFLFGSDITSTNNNELIVSETGDLLSVDGIENVYDSIETRLENNKGSLNIFSPNWGTIAIDDGNAPLLVKIDRYLTDVVEQIQADPRVESVNMNLKKLKWSGDTITVPTTVYFIGTEETREVTI